MKLILMRHAKSSWGDPTQEDRDRPLNRRGREAAPRLGAWLRANGHAPARILCSAARRTRETCDALGFDLVPEYRDDLYLASAETILSLATGPEPVLILGHNPGMSEAATRACAAPPAHPDFARYPTCATTVIDAPDGLPGRAVAFVVPRDLPAL